MSSTIGSPFAALKYRDFRLLWLGLLITRIGLEMQFVAVNWHIYLLTGSALSLGIIGLVRFLPLISFSLAGGITADTIGRKKLMLLSQIATAISSLILAVSTLLGHINPWIIYLLIGASSAASAFETPARQSLMPHLVPKQYFLNAVSLTTTMWHTAIVIGPTLAGFIIAFWGVESVYIVTTVSFLAVILALLSITAREPKVPESASFNFSSLAQGISFVKKTPIIYSSMLLDFFATFFSNSTVLLPIFAKDILLVGPKGLGLLYAAPSAGAVVTSMMLSSLGHIKNQGKILLATVSVYGLATILFGLSKSFYFSLIFLFLAGSANIISTIIRNTIRQLTTPDHLRGRMVAVNMIFFLGGPQLGETEAGILASLVGAPFSVVIGGIGTIITTFFLAIFIPVLKNYQGNEVLEV